MNPDAPLSTARMLAYLAAILGLFVLLQWHDNYTAERIAAIEAPQVRTIACDEPVTVASR